MSYDNTNDELSPDNNNDEHAGSGGPGDEPRPSNTLSIEIPKRDVVDGNESSGDEAGNGEADDDDDNLSDSEQRRRKEAGLNSPTGQNATDSQQASYASAVDAGGDGDGRDERGPRSPRRISKNAQVSWMADEQKQAGGAVTQADEAPPAALAAMLTQVDKPGTGGGGGGGNPITSVPRDQPTTTTRQESDNTDSEIRRVSQQSQQRGSWLACCSWLNCSSQVEQVDDEEPTVVGGASVDIGQSHAASRPVKTYTNGEPGGPRGISDECDGGFEPSVDYPDPYYEDGLLPRPIEQHKRQKCLVLDLDETLVHSSFKPVPNADFIIPVEIDGVIHRVYVMKRPYVDEFLARCARKYEIVVFTASLAKYANPLLDQLDPNGTVTYRLFRESCVIHQTAYVKDLTRLARPISKTIIVDNSAQSYLFQPKNAIPIPSWFDDMTDTMLMDLLPVLETTMWEIPDVRKLLDAHTKSYRWLCNQANKTPEFS